MFISPFRKVYQPNVLKVILLFIKGNEEGYCSTILKYTLSTSMTTLKKTPWNTRAIATRVVEKNSVALVHQNQRKRERRNTERGEEEKHREERRKCSENSENKEKKRDENKKEKRETLRRKKRRERRTDSKGEDENQTSK